MLTNSPRNVIIVLVGQRVQVKGVGYMDGSKMTCFANRIRGLCISKGKTIKDLQNALELSRTALDNRFRDDSLWKFEDIIKISKWLETDISFFLSE